MSLKTKIQIYSLFGKAVTAVFLAFCCLPLSSQTLITKNFEFADGIYFTLQDLQKNTPSHTWEELKTNLAANPQTYMAQVEYLIVKETQDTLQLDSVYALSLGGIPFVRLPKGAVNKELTAYAGLRVRGRWCYYSYEDTGVKKVPISAYNPLNGRPFRTAMVEREETVEYHKLLSFETGETMDFTGRNFLKIIKDDKNLTEAVMDIRGEDAGQKLFKSLLIYDDRHPIYITE